MTTRSIYYRFTQRFNAPARYAYRWCTDYKPDDLSLMGENGVRKIERISSDAFILTDTFNINQRGKKKIFSKKKLVRLNPKALSWTNTHIAGPVKYSQFLYQIVPEGKNASRLEFTGLQIEYGKATGGESVSKLAEKYRKEDSGAWKRLAKAMSEDV